jgi:2-oxoglutarate/2-oxoacid ferredoxin oxidoreductase subunit alpha
LIINVQRGGPSTGLPTKTEQADLFQAMYGRNGECPVPIVAAQSPGDCFYIAQEAWRIATKYMTPVFIMTDGYLANGSEPWRVPKAADLPKIHVTHPGAPENGEAVKPYQRDERLARPWILPGTPKLMHRVGGLEKQDITGNVSYDAHNHEHMVHTRAAKVAGIAKDIPPLKVEGAEKGKLLVLSWGGTYGSCRTAVRQLLAQGKSIAHAHLRYLNPFPANLGDLLTRYDKVIIPEWNLGQLRLIIRGMFLNDALGFNKVQGKPFTVAELVHRFEELV